ncbi:chorismate mutase [Desulfovibrio sp. OttesenSCG-928-G15]|nr:chorismate mutase [Desulfovibrio sp. OttesenSCG-928-G15]
MKELDQLDLEQLRDGIRAIDAQLVRLLGERAAYSLAVGKVKRALSEESIGNSGKAGLEGSDEKKDAEAAVFHPGREADILRHLETLCDGPLPKAHLRAIYREILSSSRNLQRPQRVAFHGPVGSPAHLAGKNLLGSLADFHPRQSLEDVFQAVSSADCEIGIVPRETVPQDSPHAGLALFMRYPGICILADTATRFAIIGRTPAEAPGPESTSLLMFSLPDEADKQHPSGMAAAPTRPDTAEAARAMLCAAGLHIRKLESRPRPQESGKCMFFAEIAGNILSSEHAGALESVRKKCLTFRLLGCYPTLEYCTIENV